LPGLRGLGDEIAGGLLVVEIKTVHGAEEAGIGDCVFTPPPVLAWLALPPPLRRRGGVPGKTRVKASRKRPVSHRK
jgi:hypothetical protein